MVLSRSPRLLVGVLDRIADSIDALVLARESVLRVRLRGSIGELRNLVAIPGVVHAIAQCEPLSCVHDLDQ